VTAMKEKRAANFPALSSIKNFNEFGL
jgi:hypothetical protein